MTNGTISQTWYDNCLYNGSADEIRSWFAAFVNQDVHIDEQLSVWVHGGSDGGRWLSQDEIDDACKAIDAGV